MNRLLIIGFCLCLFATLLRADNATTVIAAPTGKPSFIAIDTLVLNLNAVAGINYSSSPNAGATVVVTYLNGNTSSYYNMKVTPAEWAKIQAEIVAAGNK